MFKQGGMVINTSLKATLLESGLNAVVFLIISTNQIVHTQWLLAVKTVGTG